MILLPGLDDLTFSSRGIVGGRIDAVFVRNLHPSRPHIAAERPQRPVSSPFDDMTTGDPRPGRPPRKRKRPQMDRSPARGTLFSTPPARPRSANPRARSLFTSRPPQQHPRLPSSIPGFRSAGRSSRRSSRCRSGSKRTANHTTLATGRTPDAYPAKPDQKDVQRVHRLVPCTAEPADPKQNFVPPRRTSSDDWALPR